MNSELYELLKDNANEDGLPVMDENMFSATTNEYGQEVFRETLTNYIITEQPPFPLKKFDLFATARRFYSLCETHWEDSFSRPDDVHEKHDDYKYPYSAHGLGVLKCSATYNYTSDSFMNDLRLACDSKDQVSPVLKWRNPKSLKNTLSVIWTDVNEKARLSEDVYRTAFRLGGYTATQFKPLVAKSIYDMTGARTVLDTSMGWGDRLTAFFASDATHFIGCDPNPHAFERYQQMVDYWTGLLETPLFGLSGNNQKTTKLYNCGAEDLPWDEINNVDVAFTSPPYFSTELYNKHGDKSEMQSWAKYPEYDAFRDAFFLPVALSSYKALSETGVLMVNIMDPEVDKVRYHTTDELVDALKHENSRFIGQMGMQIKRRPMQKSVFTDAEGYYDKRAAAKHVNQVFIDNIWCFAKSANNNLEKALATIPPTPTEKPGDYHLRDIASRWGGTPFRVLPEDQAKYAYYLGKGQWHREQLQNTDKILKRMGGRLKITPKPWTEQQTDVPTTDLYPHATRDDYFEWAECTDEDYLDDDYNRTTEGLIQGTLNMV